MATEKNVIPIRNLGLLYANGCLMKSTGLIELQISPGQVRDSTDFFDIKVDEPIDVDLSIEGINGRVGSAVLSSTWYYVFLLSSKLDGVVPAAIAVPSTDNLEIPVVPSVITFNRSYDISRPLGWVLIGPSGDIWGFTMEERGNFRELIFNESFAVILNNQSTVLPPVFVGDALTRTGIAPTTTTVTGRLILEVMAGTGFAYLSNFPVSASNEDVALWSVASTPDEASMTFTDAVARQPNNQPGFHVSITNAADELSVSVNRQGFNI